jgi:hypothetical protein
MSYLLYLCLPPHSGVQHILCSVLCFDCHCLVSIFRPVASHWQTLLHIVLSSTPRHYSVNGNVERLN